MNPQVLNHVTQAIICINRKYFFINERFFLSDMNALLNTYRLNLNGRTKIEKFLAVFYSNSFKRLHPF